MGEFVAQAGLQVGLDRLALGGVDAVGGKLGDGDAGMAAQFGPDDLADIVLADLFVQPPDVVRIDMEPHRQLYADLLAVGGQAADAVVAFDFALPGGFADRVGLLPGVVELRVIDEGRDEMEAFVELRGDHAACAG